MNEHQRSEHVRLLVMIEEMERQGRPEHAIHDAVRRAVREDRAERRRDGRASVLRRLGRPQTHG
jgi:hypothetical protein